MTAPESDIPPQASPEDDRPHRPADDREEIYFQGSPLLRGELGRLFGFTLLGLLIAAFPIIYRVLHRNGAWPAWWVTLALFVIGVFVLFIPLLLVKALRYRISNYRIDCEKGLLSKTIDTLELWHVEDITCHQSLIDRVLRVGTITVLSHDDTTPRLELKSIPDPRPLFDQLKRRVISVKRQRGVIKMDMGADFTVN